MLAPLFADIGGDVCKQAYPVKGPYHDFDRVGFGHFLIPFHLDLAFPDSFSWH
jgi:hypothetical protein